MSGSSTQQCVATTVQDVGQPVIAMTERKDMVDCPIVDRPLGGGMVLSAACDDQAWMTSRDPANLEEWL